MNWKKVFWWFRVTFSKRQSTLEVRRTSNGIKIRGRSWRVHAWISERKTQLQLHLNATSDDLFLSVTKHYSMWLILCDGELDLEEAREFLKTQSLTLLMNEINRYGEAFTLKP